MVNIVAQLAYQACMENQRIAYSVLVWMQAERLAYLGVALQGNAQDLCKTNIKDINAVDEKVAQQLAKQLQVSLLLQDIAVAHSYIHISKAGQCMLLWKCRALCIEHKCTSSL